MAFELSGTVKEIFPEQTFASGFNKREFVVTTEDKFPQDIKFECLKEKVELVAKLKKNEKVNVSFDVNGREWNGKYFVNLVAWKIDAGSKKASSDEPPQWEPDEAEITDDDDVPF